MLELKNIVKDYPTGDNTVHALRGVSLRFRKSEFVSILGQSGCGKTTMLNIIGGLDRYTSGDLIISGRSTKDYRDRDWDAYRNHSVGFVFQSYHLIPHQSVLQNVELALTLSGVSKSERRRRAKEALAMVGLADQLRKRPSEMSGGQMQRVAIARAIVNDPEIILADEPTGALDSETSVQVMEILKRISKERLVIMVTHNPELAEQYSTRTVRMLDGVVVSDSAPLTEEEIAAEDARIAEQKKVTKKVKKPSMSFATSFGLSLRNLFTKKARTTLTAFAGSIGIIGITLIYAVSNGMTAYINTVQEDTLSSYPLTLEAQHVDIGNLMMSFIGTAKQGEEHENDAVYQKPVLYDLVNTLSSVEAKENDLKSFKEYLEAELSESGTNEELKNAISGVQYTYDFDLQIYTKNVDGNIIKSDTEELIRSMLIQYMGLMSGSATDSTESSGSGLMSMLSSSTSSSMLMLWQEILPAKDGGLVSEVVKKQYDLIRGDWPTAYNEILLVVDENNEIDDMTLYALGLISDEEIDKIVNAAVNKTEVSYETKKWSYDEILSMEFRTILGADCYTDGDNDGIYTDIRENESSLKYLYEKGIPLKVVGIIRQNEDAVAGMLSGTIAYTSALTQYIVTKNAESLAVQAQLQNPTTDIFTGLPFKDDGNMDLTVKKERFVEHVLRLSAEEQVQAYLSILCIPDASYVEAQVAQRSANVTTEEMKQTILAVLQNEMTAVSAEELAEYIEMMSEEDVRLTYAGILEGQVRAEYAAAQLLANQSRDPAELLLELQENLPNYSEEQCSDYYDAILTFSASTYENNLHELGYVELDQPSSINLYASTFAEKDVIEDGITAYNESVDELSQISYTDYVGLMMSSVTTIINAITYVLIAFVAVSLIVSSIMIGVITLISVQERTKEIGILRAIGASKRNISSMFNAETLIIGFSSGLMGVLMTSLLCIPINLILYALTGIGGLQAVLPLDFAVIMIAISMILTLIAGIIPSRSAAKKDPVVALRTE